MRLAALIIVASCAVLKCRCASLGGESRVKEADSRQTNSSSSSIESRFRQLNSIEPFLQDRARQIEGRQSSSSQDSFASLTNNLNLSGGSRSRQLAYSSYTPAPNSYGQQAVQATGYSYSSPNNAYYQQTAPQAVSYIASKAPAYLPPAPLQTVIATQAYLSAAQQQYGPNSIAPAAELTRVTYEGDAAEKATSSPQYASRLPEVHEVIELRDPNIRIFSSRRGNSSSQKKIVTFRLARRLRVPLVARDVMQPEFYLQDGQVSYDPDRTTVQPTTTTTTSTTTTTTPKPTTNTNQPQETTTEIEPDGQVKSAPEEVQELTDSNQSDGQDESSETESPDDSTQEPSDADSTSADADPSSQAEVDPQGAIQEAGSNLGGEQAGKLANEVGLENRLPHEAEIEAGQEPDERGGQSQEQGGKLALSGETPSIGLSGGEVEVSPGEASGQIDGAELGTAASGPSSFLRTSLKAPTSALQNVLDQSKSN